MVCRRSRLTRELINQANQRLRGCEFCWRRDAVQFADEVLSVLKPNYRESDRLFRKLRCPSCDTRILPETLVASTGGEDLRRFASYAQFEIRHGRNLKRLRNALTDRSKQCLMRRVDAKVASAIRATKRIVLDDTLVWHYAVPTGERPPSQAGGRYHGAADKTYYAAGDPRTAAVEALRGRTLGPIEIFAEKLDRPFLVLDLRERPGADYPFPNRFLRNIIALGYLSEPAPFGQSGQDGYRVPQLVAHWARQCGVDGILYTSTRPSPYGSPLGGDCLAIFNTDKVRKGPSPVTFRFSGPDLDISFPEKAWKLIPSSVENGTSQGREQEG